MSHNNIGDVQLAQGDRPAALTSYRASLTISERLAKTDPSNAGWQRDLSVSNNRIGDVLNAQGDLPGALAAYRKGLANSETLAARDPANVQWQIDIAASYGKLGLHAGVSVDERRDYLRRGLKIQQGLKASGRLPPNQDWIASFEAVLQKLGQD